VLPTLPCLFVKLRNQNVTMTNALSANFTMQTVILYTQAKYLYTRILYGNKLFTIYKCNTCATQAVA